MSYDWMNVAIAFDQLMFTSQANYMYEVYAKASEQNDPMETSSLLLSWIFHLQARKTTRGRRDVLSTVDQSKHFCPLISDRLDMDKRSQK